MASVLLLHHAQGRTEGMHELAGRFGAAGHAVHLPDLYGGRTFDDLDEGVAHAQGIGMAEVAARGVAAADDLPERLAVVGFSLGVMAAQQLAQTRPGTTAAVFFAACLPADEFGAWPDAVPVQVHGAEADPLFAGEGDLDAARDLVAAAPDGELFLYPGHEHLFVDSSLPGFDAGQTDLFLERALALLARAD